MTEITIYKSNKILTFAFTFDLKKKDKDKVTPIVNKD